MAKDHTPTPENKNQKTKNPEMQPLPLHHLKFNWGKTQTHKKINKIKTSTSRQKVKESKKTKKKVFFP